MRAMRWSRRSVKLQVRENLVRKRRRPSLSGGGVARCRAAADFGVELPVTLEGGRRDGDRDRTAREADRRDLAGSHAHRHSRSAAQLAQSVGRAGHADGDGGAPGRWPVRGHRIPLASRDLHATGNLEAQLEPLRLTWLQLDQVRFGETRATLVARQSDAAGYDVRIDAQTLDLAPCSIGRRSTRSRRPAPRSSAHAI